MTTSKDRKVLYAILSCETQFEIENQADQTKSSNIKTHLKLVFKMILILFLN